MYMYTDTLDKWTLWERQTFTGRRSQYPGDCHCGDRPAWTAAHDELHSTPDKHSYK